MGALSDAVNSAEHQAYEQNTLQSEGDKLSGELQILKTKLKETDFVQAFRQLCQNPKRFVGAMLSNSYQTATVNTSNEHILNQHGIATGALLVATVPSDLTESHKLPDHFLLLRVVSKEEEAEEIINQLASYDRTAYFQPSTDVPQSKKRTDLKLSYSVQLKCLILGMFYKHLQYDSFDFTTQLDMILSASHYWVYKPDHAVQNLIINSQMILDAKADQSFDYFPIGEYRETEAEAFLPPPEVFARTTVYENIAVFKNARTANFGNTRFGKSNLNKICASNIIKYNLLHEQDPSKRIGMIVYDENGEYYHENSQDKTSLYNKFKEHHKFVARYSLRANERNNLMLNFYLSPDEGLQACKAILKDGTIPIYLETFFNLHLLSLADFLKTLAGESHLSKPQDAQNAIFLVQQYWVLLHVADFAMQSNAYKEENRHNYLFDKLEDNPNRPFAVPEWVKMALEQAKAPEELLQAWQQTQNDGNLHAQFQSLVSFVRSFNEFYLHNKKPFQGQFWDNLDPMIEMFNTSPSKGGYKRLLPVKILHSPLSKNQLPKLIKDVCDEGKVCILDLSATTHPKAKKFFAERIDTHIFKRAEKNFSENLTHKKPMILLNYEEAHNLFPSNASANSIYIKLAREGAKMQIGIIYNTQLISHIYGELKSLTENLFIGHINNQAEIADLATINYAFKHSHHEIMSVSRVGYMLVKTRHRRFPIRVQIHKFA